MNSEYLRKIVCPKLRRAGLLDLISTKERLVFYVPAMGKGKYARKKLSDILSGVAHQPAPQDQSSLSFGKLGDWDFDQPNEVSKLSDKLSDSPSLLPVSITTVVPTKVQHDSRPVEKSIISTAVVENSATVKAMKSRLKTGRGAGVRSDRPAASKDRIADGDPVSTKRLHIRAAAWDDPAA